MRRTLAPAIIGAALVLSLAPFYWMLVVSLSSGVEQITLGNPWVLHDRPFLGNYSLLLTSPKFGRWMLNTLLVTGGTVALSLGASLAAGYALATLRPVRARGIVAVLLATYVLPQTVLALPLLTEMSSLGIADSPLALLLAYPGLVVPFGTWAFWSLFSGEVVSELVENARLEGGRGVSLLMGVLLPLARPVLIAVAIFGVAIVFNDYLYLFTLVTGDRSTTVMGGVETQNVDVEDPGFAFAAMLLGAGPIAFLCAWYAERYLGSRGPAVID